MENAKRNRYKNWGYRDSAGDEEYGSSQQTGKGVGVFENELALCGLLLGVMLNKEVFLVHI